MQNTDQDLMESEDADEFKLSENTLAGDPECECEPRWARKAVGKENLRVGRLRKRVKELQAQIESGLEEMHKLREQNEFLRDSLDRIMAAWEARDKQGLGSDAEGTDETSTASSANDNHEGMYSK